MKKISIVTKLLKEKGVKIFVINYEPLKERRDYLSKRIEDLGLGKLVSWFIQKKGQYDKIIPGIYNEDGDEWQRRMSFVKGPGFKKMAAGEINLELNHLEIYKKIKKQKIRTALILEDDVILEDDFLERLVKCVVELPSSFDVAYTDAGIYLRLQKKISKMKFARHSNPITRTTASYFISNNGAKKFLNSLDVLMPIDLNMRYFEERDHMNVYWLNGYLTYQGSVYGGFYKTVLQDERSRPSLSKRIILSIENYRYKKGIFSKVIVFLFDYLFLKPYRIIK